jgi:hypothetical protein
MPLAQYEPSKDEVFKETVSTILETIRSTDLNTLNDQMSEILRELANLPSVEGFDELLPSTRLEVFANVIICLEELLSNKRKELIASVAKKDEADKLEDTDEMKALSYVSGRYYSKLIKLLETGGFNLAYGSVKVLARNSLIGGDKKLAAKINEALSAGIEL